MDSCNVDGTTERAAIERLKSVLHEVRGSEPGAGPLQGAGGGAASGVGAAVGPVLSPERRAAIKHLLSHASPAMIAQAEQELRSEGVTIEELSAACEVHLELFREAAGEQRLDLPPDHPLSRFEQDHEVIFAALDELRSAAARARSKASLAEASGEIEEMRRCVELLLAAENHNVRQENTLFPMLERYGIEQPPAIMWQEHMEMREDKRRIAEALEAVPGVRDLADRIQDLAVALSEAFASHSRKERQILYPAALELFSAEDWRDIKEECDSLGYFTDRLPPTGRPPQRTDRGGK